MFPAVFQFFRDIRAMQMNLASVHASKSYCYLTRSDFAKAFSDDETVLVAKDYNSVKFNFETNSGASSSLLLNNHRDSKLLNVHILGEVTKPVQVKLVNCNSNESCDSNLLFSLEDMLCDDAVKKEKKSSSAVITVKRKVKQTPRSQNLHLFRRTMKYRKYLELTDEERKNMAKVVLDCDKSKDKSLFHTIDEMNMLSPSDYIEPDFIELEQPVDVDYEDNYSQIAPSVHDLFDLDIESVNLDANSEEGMEYYVTEYLDEDEEM